MRHLQSYKAELILDKTYQNGDFGGKVKNIQEWLTLCGQLYPNKGFITAIDGIFGPATAKSVSYFQQYQNSPTINGIVDDLCFYELANSLRNAFEYTIPPLTLAQTVIKVAEQHCTSYAHELQKTDSDGNLIGNLGPWVRSYCGGIDGNQYSWCMGFIQCVFDQAYDMLSRDFTIVMPITLDCDNVGTFAINKGKLLRNTTNQLQNNLAKIKPGDIFLYYSENPKVQWHHAGIIVAIDQNVITTIEGNSTLLTNSDNGIGVYKKTHDILNRVTTKDNFLNYYEVYSI